MELKISEELKELIPALQDEERELLEESLLEEGCRDSLVVWGDTIIDGHNRYEICKQHDIPFEVTEMEFVSISEVKNWMIDNQLARRNLTDSQRRYFIGKRYEEEKKPIGYNQHNRSGQNVQPSKTAEEIGRKNNVTGRTVRRSEEYSKAIDELKKADKKMADDILAERIKLQNKEVIGLSKEEPEKQKKVLDIISSGKAKRVKEAEEVIDPEEAKKRREHEERQAAVNRKYDQNLLVADLINNGKYRSIDKEHVKNYLELTRIESFKNEFVDNCDKMINKLEEMKSYYYELNRIRRVK